MLYSAPPFLRFFAVLFKLWCHWTRLLTNQHLANKNNFSTQSNYIASICYDLKINMSMTDR